MTAIGVEQKQLSFYICCCSLLRSFYYFHLCCRCELLCVSLCTRLCVCMYACDWVWGCCFLSDVCRFRYLFHFTISFARHCSGLSLVICLVCCSLVFSVSLSLSLSLSLFLSYTISICLSFPLALHFTQHSCATERFFFLVQFIGLFHLWLYFSFEMSLSFICPKCDEMLGIFVTNENNCVLWIVGAYVHRVCV